MSKTIPIFLLVFLSLKGVPFGKDDNSSQLEVRRKIESLKKENKKLDADLQKTDSLRREEESRFKKMSENYSRDLVRRQSEIKELQTKLSELNAKNAGERREQARLSNAIDEQKARNKVYLETLKGECVGLERLIMGTLPWKREKRLENVRILKRDLESGSATLEEGFNRLKALYNDEIKFGDEITVTNTSVTRNNGELINAVVLRMGNQWLVYADEEDRHYGVLKRVPQDSGIQYIWKEDLTFKERDAIRNAIDVKTAKMPPTLVTLPLSLALQIGAGQKEGE